MMVVFVLIVLSGQRVVHFNHNFEVQSGRISCLEGWGVGILRKEHGQDPRPDCET